MTKRESSSGQAMILATLALGGVILGATTIAGMLILYQLRASTDSENSAKSIYAADSGVEWALFNFYCGQASPVRCAPSTLYPLPVFTALNGATTSIECDDATGRNAFPCYATSTVVSAIARGFSLNTERIFYLTFSTGTFP